MLLNGKAGNDGGLTQSVRTQLLTPWLRAAAPCPPPCQLTTFTSDLPGAATTAHVFVTLRGAAGETGALELRPAPGAAAAFARGAADAFPLRLAPDLGELRELEVAHDGAGADPGWHLARVEVLHCGSGKVRMPRAAGMLTGRAFAREGALSIATAAGGPFGRPAAQPAGIPPSHTSRYFEGCPSLD